MKQSLRSGTRLEQNFRRFLISLEQSVSGCLRLCERCRRRRCDLGLNLGCDFRPWNMELA